jgi:hypothetical protein
MRFLRQLLSGFAPIVGLIILAPPLFADPRAPDLRATYARLRAQFADAVTGWEPKTTASGSTIFIAPDVYSGVALENRNVSELRAKFANEVFALSRQAAEAGELSLAFQWASEALRENPDHADARRVLGYERRGNRWLTAYSAQMADAREPKVWHEKFAWIAETDAPRYEAGERLVGGRWVTAAADAARHTNLENGWIVRTDHFLVRTDHSLEAASELAARLERLHQVWRQLFAGFYLSEREVRELFAGRRPPRRQSQPMRVFYHRDKEAYVAALAKRQPRIAETLGIYFDVDREAHFFAGDDASAGTLYHEAVHQMFQELRPAARRVGSTANFWIIEGVATYFETLREHADDVAGRYYTIGESTAGRLPAARERLLADNYYVPLAELTKWGKDDVQRHPDLAKLYSQSSGLAAFLMDAERGRYREPLVQYLNDVYAGRDNADSLSKAAGMQYAELDAAYRRYMESLP